MSRNGMYLVIVVLVAAVAGVGFLAYRESRTGIDIEIGKDGVRIEGN